MRDKIAAGNWKMNLSYQEGEELLKNLLSNEAEIKDKVIIGAPFPYLKPFADLCKESNVISIAAQNCHQLLNGAYTGEVSVAMLNSIDIKYVIIGHSERRAYFNEDEELLKAKVDICLAHGITPIFCCGEPLEIREAGNHITYVKDQIQKSLFHLDVENMSKVIMAYEPIWAIGTGVTASAEQAQEMHSEIRTMLKNQYSDELAESISILYGGSVKPANAQELFTNTDVDGGLVGGASLKSESFLAIAKSF